jgi:hypothetical protein
MKFAVSLLGLPVTALLSACSSGHPPLAVPAGDYRAMNAAHWTATADDLDGPRKPLAPKDSWTLRPSQSGSVSALDPSTSAPSGQNPVGPRTMARDSVLPAVPMAAPGASVPAQAGETLGQ